MSVRSLIVLMLLAVRPAAGADTSASAPEAWIGRCEARLRDAQRIAARQDSEFSKGQVQRTETPTCVPAPTGATGAGVWCEEPAPGSPRGLEFVVKLPDGRSFRAAIGAWQPNAVPHSWHRHTADTVSDAGIATLVWEDRTWGPRRNGFVSFVQAVGPQFSSKASFEIFKRALDQCAALESEPKR